MALPIGLAGIPAPAPTGVQPALLGCVNAEPVLQFFASFTCVARREALWNFANRRLREYFESIVITAIIALFATTYVIQAFKIPTGSMESNLLIGDHLLVNKFIYGLESGFPAKVLPYKEPKRGDVIVFKYPQ